MSQLKAGVGASDTLFQHDKTASVRRSRFDLSRLTNFTCDAGMIVPFDWFLCLPGDDVNISFEMILDTLPLINASLTSYKVLTHWYKIDLKDLWAGWQTFITRGRSGTVNWQIPRVDLNFPITSKDFVRMNFGVDDDGSSVDYDVKNFYAYSHHSLAAFLGVPSPQSGLYKRVKGGNVVLANDFAPYIQAVSSTSPAMSESLRETIHKARLTNFNLYTRPNALPFMAYQNICKYNYVPQNLLQKNTSLFPEVGDHDWFLKANASVTNFIDYASNDEVTGDEVYSYDGVYSENDTVTRLDQLRYACFDDDYFTTGLPWLQRGDVSEAGLDVDLSNIGEIVKQVDEFQSNNFVSGVSKERPAGINVGGFGESDEDSFLAVNADESTSLRRNFRLNLIKLLKKIHLNLPASSVVKASLTANQLREMLAVSVWQERNARVNGSYNSMIFAHWRSNPHAEEHKPQYIGGTADYVSFSTILQSSQSTDDSPLGSTAGRGSAGGNGFVGNVHCDDYCYIMGVMIIKPNTTYMQGVEHHLSCENVFADFPQPEFEGLSPQNILNKELYVSGDDNDNQLFAYQERYVYLKVRQNVNRGLFQVSPTKDRLFGSFTQARWFENRPTFSYQFLCMSPQNIRRDFLAYPAYPMFKLQTASKVSVVRSLAYKSEPNTFGF